MALVTIQPDKTCSRAYHSHEARMHRTKARLRQSPGCRAPSARASSWMKGWVATEGAAQDRAWAHIVWCTHTWFGLFFGCACFPLSKVVPVLGAPLSAPKIEFLRATVPHNLDRAQRSAGGADRAKCTAWGASSCRMALGYCSATRGPGDSPEFTRNSAPQTLLNSPLPGQ